MQDESEHFEENISQNTKWYEALESWMPTEDIKKNI